MTCFPGLVNSILLVTTRNVLPDTSTIPQFTTPRQGLDKNSQYGITPFAANDIPNEPSDEDGDSANLPPSRAVRPEMGAIAAIATPVRIVQVGLPAHITRVGTTASPRAL